MDSVRAESTSYEKPVANGCEFLQIRNLVKHYGGVQALKGVDINICAGRVHGLVGANGAGKSTLIRILAGVTSRDGGEILLDQHPIEIPDPQAATRLGFSFIHQELNLVPKFNVLQSMTLGLPKATNLGLISWRRTQKMVENAAQRVGINFPLTTPIQDLSVAERWLVSIARSLVNRARLIAMDEPTASLSADESERLFQIIRELSNDGIGILYVSHRLDEIIDLCDSITVFKDGQNVLSTKRGEVTKKSLVKAIVGGDVQQMDSSNSTTETRPVILETRNLSAGRYVRDVSFKLHQGEVLGFGGLVGAGRTELAQLIFGVNQPESGMILLDGNPWKPINPPNAVKHGIGYVPEERRSLGLVLEKSVGFNINLTNLKQLRLKRFLPYLNLKKSAQIASGLSKKLSIKTPSVNTRVGDLSGGNQQKVVIGKWLTRDPRILILDEPSRGVDVGARSEIHNIIRDLATRGVSIIVISSEVEELPGLCDRVMVMSEGRIAGYLKGQEITKEAIIHLSYAHSTN
ncbi:MAG: sugar ABC transporter ATP-binding protein [Veillonellaceae bacterium]|nr:sugar ABC transporter ATP-binding protein [Veillonellaceae bacterium]